MCPVTVKLLIIYDVSVFAVCVAALIVGTVLSLFVDARTELVLCSELLDFTLLKNLSKISAACFLKYFFACATLANKKHHYASLICSSMPFY